MSLSHALEWFWLKQNAVGTTETSGVGAGHGIARRQRTERKYRWRSNKYLLEAGRAPEDRKVAVVCRILSALCFW